jgi:hypothetical protein
VCELFEYGVLPRFRRRSDHNRSMACILLFLAPLYDRRNELARAEDCIKNVIAIGQRIGLSSSDPLLCRARSELAHCYIKAEVNLPTRDRRRLTWAQDILHGTSGPAPHDLVLHTLSYYYAKGDHEAVKHVFARSKNSLDHRGLTVAHETMAASALRAIVTMSSEGRFLPERTRNELIADAREHDRRSFCLAIRSATPRTIFLRSLNLVRSSRADKDWATAAQALLFADMWQHGSTGVDPRLLACRGDSDYAVEPAVMKERQRLLKLPQLKLTYDRLAAMFNGPFA